MAAGAALVAKRGAAEGVELLSPGSPGVAGSREPLGMQEAPLLLGLLGA